MTADVPIEAAIAAIVGIGIGVLLMFLVRRRPHADDGAAPSSLAAGAPAGISMSDDQVMLATLPVAVDQLDVGVVVMSTTKQVVFRNAAARSSRGTHVGVLIDDHVAAIAAEAGSHGRVQRLVEIHGPPKIWLEITADPLPGGGVVAMIRDVSQRVRTDAMRTDFVTNVSHELKTPIGAIAVLAETLIDEPDPVVVERLAARLVEEAHRAARTVDDLLELSQIESARPSDSLVDLEVVLQLAIDRGRSADGGRSVEIVVLESPGALVVRGDEMQLASAVGNLVENAVKYSHAGGTVQVGARSDASMVEITVVDQGVGIPTRDLDRVFERFYRVDRARSRETGGTGLGLSIVRHVAANHGGDVLISSVEGEGSTFVLRLPTSIVVADLSLVEQETADHE